MNTSISVLEIKFDTFQKDFHDRLVSSEERIKLSMQAMVDSYLAGKELDLEPLFSTEFSKRFKRQLSSVSSSLSVKFDSQLNLMNTTEFLANDDSSLLKTRPNFQ